MVNYVKPITNNYLLPTRYYYCEKWNDEQEILKIKNQEFKKLVSFKLSNKETFIYEEIKKITKQNEKILTLLNEQNVDIEIIKKKL